MHFSPPHGSSVGWNHGCKASYMPAPRQHLFTRLMIDAATIRPFFTTLVALRRERTRGRVPDVHTVAGPDAIPLTKAA